MTEKEVIEIRIMALNLANEMAKNGPLTVEGYYKWIIKEISTPLPK